MEEVMSRWSGLGLQRQVTAILAALAVLAAVLFLARTATEPSMSLLYAGLEPSAAGEVVAALEARGEAVDIRGTAIYVAASRRDALRMALAGEGLPATGGQGYELLDTLSGFGTTSQMFDAAYWRAKEGELARTITSNRNVSAARVHISNPSRDPFSRGEVTSASVSVTMAGGSASPAQATAFRHLIASAVAGLGAENVSVIDSRTGLVPFSDVRGAGAGGDADAREETLRANVLRLLEAHVGTGAAIVEVTIDTVTEREAISERILDPESRVPISTDSEERSARANDVRGGQVTVASNLPAGDAGGDGQNSESNETTTREITNYEVSETTREIMREPGAIRRLSVAVLVDGRDVVNAEGLAEWQPRSSEELADLKDLVASAVGYDEARGDSITIKSLQFEPPPAVSEAPLPGALAGLDLDVMSLIQTATLALVALVLGLFVLRPILTKPAVPAPASLPAPDTGAGEDGFEPAGIALEPLDDAGGALPVALDLPGATDPADRLRSLIESRQDETVEILSQWMQGGEAAR